MTIKLKNKTVKVITGDHIGKTGKVSKHKNGYVQIEGLHGLNSRKKSYLCRIHESNLKII